ncbi:MAG: hypothetical protein JRE64_03045 [Deltaproteobacteria bacterium]|nr:hypothetical protein [Deltaproteobacteria bacterium]
MDRGANISHQGKYLKTGNNFKRIGLSIGLALLIFWVADGEARKIGTYKSLSAHVADDFQCAENIRIQVTAPSEFYFKENNTDFQNLVGSVRAVLAFECEQIKSMLIEGKVGNQVVYKGSSSASGNWAVVDAAPKSPAAKDPQSVSPAALTGAWRGTFDNQEIELVLWTRRDQTDRVEGYFYLFKHNCLMGAMGLYSENRFRIFFGKGLARDRKYNCMLNTEGFNDPNQFEFGGDGFVVNAASDAVTYDFKELILGEEIISKNSSSAAGLKQIVFKKMPLSPEMFEILKNYRNLDLGKPDAGTLAEMTKGTNGTPPTKEQKKQVTRKSNKAFTSPYHDNRFLTRWNSELYDHKSKIYNRCTVDADRRSDGKLVLKVRIADSGNCVVDLVEDRLYADGYLIKLSADADADCGNERITRGYLHPYSPKDRKWPYLEMYNDEGEVVASGALDGIKGGLPGLHPDLSRGLGKTIKALEKEIMLAKLKAIKPQTLYTQCRILEYEWDNAGEIEWCLCLDEQYRKKLSTEEYENAVKNYLNFHRLAGKDPRVSGDWRYNNVGNYCRECRENKYRGCLLRDDIAPNARNYTRLLNAFLNGDYGSIKKDMLYKNFFVDYIHAYSDWCGKSITKGVYRATRSWKEDPNTGLQVTPTELQELYIDYRYVEIYDQYLAQVNRYDTLRFLTGEFGTLIMGFLKSMLKEADNAVGARLVLNNHLNEGCSSPSVKKVYEGLLITH